MKKMLAALALALTLPTCALGDSEGVIVQSSCNIVQSGDYYLACLPARGGAWRSPAG